MFFHYNWRLYMKKGKASSIGITRRGFIKLGGIGTAALLLGPRFKILEAAQGTAPGESIIHTVCQVCSGGCAMKAVVRDGRLVELRGNPDDQVAKGVLCVKGIAAIQTLYDPDRIKYPMKRTNPDKGPGWTRSSCASPGTRPMPSSPRS
jgi:thiosulfate reductase / polysulfide reductase chain A